jgi:hypothetical protein
MGQGSCSCARYGTSCPEAPWYRHRPWESTYTWSNIWNSDALGWCMVQMIVRPCRASFCSKDTHCVHDKLSRPLQQHGVSAFSIRRSLTLWRPGFAASSIFLLTHQNSTFCPRGVRYYFHSRCVRLTSSPPCEPILSRKCRILDVSQTC